MKKLLLVLVLSLLTGCSHGDVAKFLSSGTDADITCYSGGKLIYSGKSNGIVQSEPNSDGWYFEEASTHQLVMLTGQCIIRHDTL